MSAVLTIEVRLESHVCGECGMYFAAPDYFWRERKEKGLGWYCPNGHPRVFSESKVQKLQKALAASQQQVETERAERSKAIQRAWKAESDLLKASKEAKRIAKRTSNGVCPCCNRSFVGSRLARHIATKHPGYGK